MSLPVRGAWIEMATIRMTAITIRSLPVRGAWIEMSGVHHVIPVLYSRSPCGERGLKLR